MILEGKKWENYSTHHKDSKLETYSLEDIGKIIESTIQDCKLNGVDPKNVPVFINLSNKEYLINSVSFAFGGSYKCSFQSYNFSELIFTAPDSRPEVGEYWKSRGPSSFDCSGFVVSKLAGERLLRLVKYVLETDNPKSWLDFREYEPDWIQFKFSATEFDVKLLSELSIKNNGIITEKILRTCKLNKDE